MDMKMKVLNHSLGMNSAGRPVVHIAVVNPGLNHEVYRLCDEFMEESLGIKFGFYVETHADEINNVLTLTYWYFADDEHDDSMWWGMVSRIGKYLKLGAVLKVVNGTGSFELIDAVVKRRTELREELKEDRKEYLLDTVNAVCVERRMAEKASTDLDLQFSDLFVRNNMDL